MFQSKIDSILSAIRQEAAQQQKSIEAQTQQRITAELNRAEAELLEETYQMIKQRSAAIREESGRKISLEEQNARRQLFRQRADILNEVFQEAAGRLRAFAASQDYPAFLEKSARTMAEMAKEAPVVLFAHPEQLDLVQPLTRLFASAEVQGDEAITIGGLRAECADLHQRMDDTLDGRLAAQKEWFMLHSGLTVGEMGSAAAQGGTSC